MKDFETLGFALEPGVLTPLQCATACDLVQQSPSLSGGTRSLLQAPWCAAVARDLMRHPRIAPYLPHGAVAVQCTYFEKSAQRNWLVALHQDLSIPVQQRCDADGYTGWSVKEGTVFVQPPLGVLQSLVAVRVHLEDCGPQDGPLHVVPASHAHGLLTDAQAAQWRSTTPTQACTLAVGGALVMRPLLLHASSKATGSSRRRVLHFVFGPGQLPGGVHW